jgi:hypothetical protein
MDKSYGHLLTNEREYIIITLLLYLICRTNIIIIKLFILIVLAIHIYKLYHNFGFNCKLFKNSKKEKIYNLLLLISLIIFINNNNNYILFIFVFIVTRLLIDKTNIKYNHKQIINDKIIIIAMLIFILLFPNYKYKYFIWMEILNHFLIMIV